jgi:hypothetical protein
MNQAALNAAERQLKIELGNGGVRFNAGARYATALAFGIAGRAFDFVAGGLGVAVGIVSLIDAYKAGGENKVEIASYWFDVIGGTVLAVTSFIEFGTRFMGMVGIAFSTFFEIISIILQAIAASLEPSDKSKFKNNMKPYAELGLLDADWEKTVDSWSW